MLWSGRVDKENDFDSFRWHQWISYIDLQDKDQKPYEGKLGLALLGYECEKGIIRNKGRSGAELGPAAIRSRLSNLPWHFSEDVFIFDAGDVFNEGSSLEEIQKNLAEAVERILKLNLFPILLGGGHDIAYGHYKGIFNYLKGKSEPKKIGIINFDSHFDLRPYSEGASSGTMFKQIAKFADNKDADYSYLCLGILEQCNTGSLFNTARRLGVEYVLAKDMKRASNDSLLDIIDSYVKRHDYIYVTICADVFSSAYAPGVSAPQSLGLEPEKVLSCLEHIVQSKKIISFDIAEVSPKLDLNDITSNLAANIIYSLVQDLVKV